MNVILSQFISKDYLQYGQEHQHAYLVLLLSDPKFSGNERGAYCCDPAEWNSKFLRKSHLSYLQFIICMLGAVI